MLRGLLACRGARSAAGMLKTLNATDGDRGALSPSAHHQARARPQDLSVSAARHGDHAAEPGLGDGHHVHSNGAGLRLSRRVLDWATTSSSVVAAVDHDGGGLLRRDPRGCSGPSRQAGHLQHRPGLAIYRSAFTGVLASNGIAISMDGKGAWRDNVFVERLWRSVKYEEVYLRAYETVGEARHSIGRYLDFYNGRRPHSSLDERTRIKPTLIFRRSARRPNPGRGSTYRRGESVQTTGTSSVNVVLLTRVTWLMSLKRAASRFLIVRRNHVMFNLTATCPAQRPKRTRNHTEFRTAPCATSANSALPCPISLRIARIGSRISFRVPLSARSFY